MFHLYGPPSPNHSLFLFFVGVFLVGYLICSFIGKERTGGLVGHISLGGLNVCLSSCVRSYWSAHSTLRMIETLGSNVRKSLQRICRNRGVEQGVTGYVDEVSSRKKEPEGYSAERGCTSLWQMRARGHGRWRQDSSA